MTDMPPTLPADGPSPLAVFVVVAGILIAGVVGTYWYQAHTAAQQRHERDLCAQIAGPDGYKWVPGGCYDENPLTGQYTRVDLP